MKWISYFFFYTYIGLVIIAGFWGAFINPYFDFKALFDLETSTLNEYQRINILSQYRFLRAIELGFGIFAVLFVKNIFSDHKFNLLFLLIMASGILARLVSWSVDGMPSFLMLFFMIYELIGLLIIIVYSRNKIYKHASA